MRSWDTTGHTDWPYDSHEEPDELESCEYCGAEFEIRADLLTEHDGLWACDRCLSDLTHVKYAINMQTFAAKLLNQPK